MAAAPDIKAKVYQAICDLTGQYGFARRDSIINVTGLKFSLVDEAVKSLREEDLTINRIKGGYFTPVKCFQEEPVSVTGLDDGRYKLECGDQVVTFTPRAARMAVALLGGVALLHGRLHGEPLNHSLVPADIDRVVG